MKFQDTRLKKINPNQVGTFAYPVVALRMASVSAEESELFAKQAPLKRLTGRECSANFGELSGLCSSVPVLLPNQNL